MILKNVGSSYKESAGLGESACVISTITSITQEVAGQSGMRFGRASFSFVNRFSFLSFLFREKYRI